MSVQGVGNKDNMITFLRFPDAGFFPCGRVTTYYVTHTHD